MARPKKTHHSEIYVAKESFTAVVDGHEEHFREGVTRVRKGHQILRQLGDMFEPLSLEVDYDVEQATAAPGEKRGDAA